jgi:hypothetical protein
VLIYAKKGDMAQRGHDESAGCVPSDPMAAYHEEAERVARRLEEARQRPPSRDSRDSTGFAVLVELGLLDERALLELLAEQLRMETIDLRRTTIDRATCVLLPERNARRLCALPVSRTGQQIDVAIANPTNNDVVRELIEALCAPVRLLLATRTEIAAAIDHFHSPAATQP